MAHRLAWTFMYFGSSPSCIPRTISAAYCPDSVGSSDLSDTAGLPALRGWLDPDEPKRVGRLWRTAARCCGRIEGRG